MIGMHRRIGELYWIIIVRVYTYIHWSITDDSVIIMNMMYVTIHSVNFKLFVNYNMIRICFNFRIKFLLNISVSLYFGDNFNADYNVDD